MRVSAILRAMNGSLRRLLVAFLLGLAMVSPITAQYFSQRQEIAIFRLSYYGEPRDPVPERQTVVQLGRVFRYERRVESRTSEIFRQAVGAVDEQIRSVFINLGRFDVIGLTHRLDYENVGAFADALRRYREDTAVFPEAVLLGQEAFTAEELERIGGGFIVVIPSVSFYNLAQERDGDYRATIETSFTFLDVENLSTVGQFFVETSGSHRDAVSAMRAAVNGIAPQLVYRIRDMDVFRIRTGILEVSRRSVIIEFGHNMGIRRGDEYAIVAPRITALGHQTVDETGVIVVREVREEYSVGHLLYAREGPYVGDQLREVPRLGADIMIYGNTFVDLAEQRTVFAAGLKAVLSRGYFNFRPLIGMEIPFTGTVLGLLFPMNIYLGGEFNQYLGRVKLTPSFGFGLGGGVPFNPGLFGDDFFASHFGGSARLTLNVLLNRDTLLFLEGGYARWVGFYDGLVPSELTRFFDGYGGILIGAGVTFK
ncbi:MAG: hypothetical protein EA384_08430 [Spirochaetaceae bacterium]|nr:MAG: hypothetical protein EA384_08430 [Spirochaetaceae bacterium]